MEGGGGKYKPDRLVREISSLKIVNSDGSATRKLKKADGFQKALLTTSRHISCLRRVSLRTVSKIC